MTESEWTDAGVAEMHALRLYRDEDLCPLCGGPRSVCQGVMDASAFEVPPPTRCHLTTAIELAAEPYRESKVPRALMHSARLKPGYLPSRT